MSAADYAVSAMERFVDACVAQGYNRSVARDIVFRSVNVDGSPKAPIVRTDAAWEERNPELARTLRNCVLANMFDGEEPTSGTTYNGQTLVDDIIEVVGLWLDRLGAA